jgi:hypothetical protein
MGWRNYGNTIALEGRIRALDGYYIKTPLKKRMDKKVQIDPPQKRRSLI